MEENKILLYKAPEYSHWEYMYRRVQSVLQSVADGLKQLNLPPTKELLKRLYNGESVEGDVAKENFERIFGNVPKSTLNPFREAYEKGLREEYFNALSKPLKQLEEYKGTYQAYGDSFWKYINVESGVVSLNPAYLEELDKWFCVYADSIGRKAVYDKWLQLQQAITEFGAIVKATPKSTPNSVEKILGIEGKYLLPISTPSQFCLVKVNQAGEVILNGENFKFIL